MNPIRSFTNLLRRRVCLYNYFSPFRFTFINGLNFDYFLVPKKLEPQYSTEKEPLKLEKVLLLCKVSKLDFERLSQPELSNAELEKNIQKKGIDYKALIKHHNVNKEFQEKVQSSLQQFGITVKNLNRFSCSKSDIDWCDAVIPVGGDGTFLNAARYITNRNKPVIGFNSDPFNSEGFLCLPKKFSFDIPSAIEKLKKGHFRWLFRTRIRVNFSGQCPQHSPTELHELKNPRCKLSFVVGKNKNGSTPKSTTIKYKLPVLALNEVFISEIFAAKVSYFEMCLNNSDKYVKIKSSGLCVSTGTGSTSWHLSINRISEQDVSDVLKLYNSIKNDKLTKDFENIVSNISIKFNEKLKFGPEESILAYTFRDLISLGVWPNPKGVIEPRGFANTIEVKSRCLNAGLIVDGGISFPFNEGSVAFLETRPEDALRTVVLE